MFSKFIGKDKSGVESMKTDPSGEKVDAVSQATYSSDAIRRAVVNAFDSNN